MPNTSLPFTKMHGAGNDFVLIDNRTLKLSDHELSQLAVSVCDRKFGVGSDGIIALQFDDTKKADLVMMYKNPDGSDAGMCGNGARCFASYAVTLGSPRKFSFRVHDHVYKADVKKDNVIISFSLTTEVAEQSVANEPLLNIYTNTEHIVCPVQADELQEEQMLVNKGRFFRSHPAFKPKGTNVNFISGMDKSTLSLQTYERGVENLTLACGTGAIASALGWHHLQQEKPGDYKYTIKVKGGELIVHFSFMDKERSYKNIKLEGPATFVFEGHYYFS
jgi:diaminopimelate epimerase